MLGLAKALCERMSKGLSGMIKSGLASKRKQFLMLQKIVASTIPLIYIMACLNSCACIMT